MIEHDAYGRPTRGAVLIIGIALAIAFALYLWIGDVLGSSIGKRLLGLRVVRSDTWKRPGLARGTLRALFKAFTIATLGTGYLAMALDSQRRSLHDSLAGTRVIER